MRKILTLLCLYAVVGSVNAGFFFEEDVFFEGMPQVVINNTLSLEAQEEEISWTRQLFQLAEDIFSWFVQDEDTCQILVDDNSTFSNPEINHRVLVTDFTYGEYLAGGTYHWKVRCKRGDRWSSWSEVKEIDHIEGSIYFDWTINNRV